MKIFFIFTLLITIFLGMLVAKRSFSSFYKCNKKVINISSSFAVVLSIIACITLVMSYNGYYWNGFYTNQIIYLLFCFSNVISYYYSRMENNNGESMIMSLYIISISVVLLISLSISINGFVEVKNKVLYETNEFRLEKPNQNPLEEELNFPYLFVKKGWFDKKYISKSKFDDFRVNDGVEIKGPITYFKKRFLKFKEVKIIPFDGGYCLKVKFENDMELEADYYLDK